MSRNLEARLAKLEQSAGLKNSGPTVILVSFAGARGDQLGNLVGYEANGEFIERPASESEDAFTQRVVAECEATWRGPNLRILIERRAEA